MNHPGAAKGVRGKSGPRVSLAHKKFCEPSAYWVAKERRNCLMHVTMVTERVVQARGRRVNMATILKHISSSNTLSQVLVPITLLLLTVMPFQMVYGIDCFKCVSMNGANKACDDPFHNNYSAAILESPCMGGRKGRDGLFPATSCIKIAGYYDDTGETITVRGCALDSGTLTTDTEIIRMSHCGRFYYDDRYVHGCLQSCNDADACNAAPKGSSTLWLILLAIIGSLLRSATLQPSGWLRIVNGS